MSRFLIAGLGNIGQEYAHTRHNIGFDIADALVLKHGGMFKTERLADVASFHLKGREITVIKPATYMNLSGRAVRYWMDHKKVELGQLLVLVDDIALRPAETGVPEDAVQQFEGPVAHAAHFTLRCARHRADTRGFRVRLHAGPAESTGYGAAGAGTAN